jgi:hypothetical protein
MIYRCSSMTQFVEIDLHENLIAGLRILAGGPLGGEASFIDCRTIAPSVDTPIGR